MRREDSNYRLNLVSNEQDLLASQRLRYKVFVEELGGNGPLVDHQNRFEIDPFDEFSDHLVLIDTNIPEASLDHVIGSYRLLRGDIAFKNNGFYSSSEFDLTSLINSGRKLLELGRSCVHPDYRGGTFMFQLWNGLAGYVINTKSKSFLGWQVFMEQWSPILRSLYPTCTIGMQRQKILRSSPLATPRLRLILSLKKKLTALLRLFNCLL